MAVDRILHTFDHELFLGPYSGSVERCMIEPGNRIIELFRKHSATAIFFVDSTYLTRVEKDDPAAYAKVSDQIGAILDAGCEIGLHLHPHWLDAVASSCQGWCLEDVSRYRLHALDNETLAHVFATSLESLTRAAKRAGQAASITTFRAGGWSLQPFDRLGELFRKYGIAMDFSVTPGFHKVRLPAHFYDYRQAPKDRAVWKFSTDPCRPDPGGDLVEVPVTAFRPALPALVRNHLAIRRGGPVYGDGRGVVRGRFRELAGKVLAAGAIRQLTLDMCSRPMLNASLAATAERTIRSFASHPKIMTAEALENLDFLLQNHRTVGSRDLAAMA